MKNAPFISVGIVFHAPEVMMLQALSSLLSQSFEDFEILLRDQSPSGSASKWLFQNIPQEMEDVRIRLFKGDNLFHSGGHNALIREMRGEVYCCASNDMEYDQELLRIVANALYQHSDIDTFVPKLFRWNEGRTEEIDSCSIGITASHYCYDKGHGKPDAAEYQREEEVFGGSGALFCIRKRALEEIRNGEEYFDELLHYKNDVDIMYRLQWIGKKCLFLPEAHAWHARQARKNGKKSNFIRESSLFGQIVLLRKHVWHILPFSIQLQSGIRITFLLLWTFMSSPQSLFRVLQKLNKKKKEIEQKRESLLRTISPERICSFLERK